RVRADYVSLTMAVNAPNYVANNLGFLMSGESEQDRNARLEKILRGAFEPLEAAVARLKLDSGTEAAVTTFEAAWPAFTRYRIGLDVNRLAPGSTTIDEIQSHLSTLSDAAKDLLAQAKEHLARLDQPL